VVGGGRRGGDGGGRGEGMVGGGGRGWWGAGEGPSSYISTIPDISCLSLGTFYALYILSGAVFTIISNFFSSTYLRTAFFTLYPSILLMCTRSC
jgi:hypothetical protein